MAYIEGDPGLYDIGTTQPEGWNELKDRAALLAATSEELGMLGVAAANAEAPILAALRRHWQYDQNGIGNTYLYNPDSQEAPLAVVVGRFNDWSKRNRRPSIATEDLTGKVGLEPFGTIADRNDTGRGIAVRALLGEELFVPKGDVGSGRWRDEVGVFKAQLLAPHFGKMAYYDLTPKGYITLAAQRRIMDETPLGTMRFPDVRDSQGRYLTMRTDRNGRLAMSETSGEYDEEIGIGIDAVRRHD